MNRLREDYVQDLLRRQNRRREATEEADRRHIDRLQERGLSDMSIEGAIMRKLLLIARAVVKNAGHYDETRICRQSA